MSLKAGGHVSGFHFAKYIHNSLGRIICDPFLTSKSFPNSETTEPQEPDICMALGEIPVGSVVLSRSTPAVCLSSSGVIEREITGG